jgi:sulfoxide reductase heme-binding subunit YedZ
VYVAAFAGVLHYFWLVKKDIHYPLLYGIVLIALLAIRIWWAADRARVRKLPRTADTQVKPAA